MFIGYCQKGHAWTSPKIVKIKQTENKIAQLPTDDIQNSASSILLIFSHMDERAARRAGISVVFLLVLPVGELLCKEQKGMSSWHKNAGWFLGMTLRCQ